MTTLPSLSPSHPLPADGQANAAPRPMGWRSSLLHFGIPAAATFAAFHVFRPWLEQLGYDPLTSYLGALCVPLALLFAAALIGYHKVEGRPLTRQAFAERMRYPRLRGRDWLWGVAIFVIGFLGYGILSQAVLALIRAGWMPLPGNLPPIADPLAVFSIETINQAAGGAIRGRWDIAVLYLVTFFFNIAGEELWWRGYILPRQEQAFGRHAWLAHGTLWAAFHVFKWWDVLALLPICLLIAFASQKLRTNWPALIAHALMNGLGVLGLILLIAS